MNQQKNPNQFEITGRLHEVMAAQQVSEKFRKREFILEIPGQYPEHIKFQLVQEKTALVDALEIGAQVKVEFNLRGRMFDKGGASTNFTNLEAWRLTRVEQEPQEGAASAPTGREPAMAGKMQPTAQL